MAKAKKDMISPFEKVCIKADSLSKVYKSNSYWQVLKRGCDFVRNEGEDTELDVVASAVKTEQKSWGVLMSEYNSLGVVLGEMGA